MPVTPEQVHPELREATARMQRMPAIPRPVVRTLVRVLPVRRVTGVRVDAVRSGRLRLRVYRPEVRRSPAVLLWIHGGGLVIGDARQDEPLCAGTAARLGIAVVSANYRLAPEHPFPAALDDVHDAWTWVQRHTGALSIDRTRVAVGGESAGAGLAAALVQRIHDEAGVQPVAQWLFAPMIDDRTAARRELDGEAHPVWSNAQNREGWAGYLGHEPGLGDPPPYAAAARRTDLTGLPPAFLAWGDIELFAGEDAAYAAAMTAAGVETEVEVVPGAPHGFENWARRTQVARDLVTRAQDWLGRHLGGSDGP